MCADCFTGGRNATSSYEAELTDIKKQLREIKYALFDLRDILRPDGFKIPEMKEPGMAAEIVPAACREFDVGVTDISSRFKDQRFVVARTAVAVLMREHHYSLYAIGALLGGRHHTTVMALLHNSNKYGSKFQAALSRIRAAISQQPNPLNRGDSLQVQTQ